MGSQGGSPNQGAADIWRSKTIWLTEPSILVTGFLIGVLHITISSPSHYAQQAGQRSIRLQPRPSRACRKRRLKNGKGFFARPRGKESDCNSLCSYTRSLNSQQPPPKSSTSISNTVAVYQIMNACGTAGSSPGGVYYSVLGKLSTCWRHGSLSP